LKVHPNAVKTKDKNGRLPLHVALLVNASPNVISMLFQAYPEAVKEKDDNEDFPLHLALSNQAPPEIVKMIFQAYEKAAKENNDNGDSPLHHALLETSGGVTHALDNNLEVAQEGKHNQLEEGSRNTSTDNEDNKGEKELDQEALGALVGPNHLMVAPTFTTNIGIQEEMKGIPDDNTTQNIKQLLIGPVKEGQSPQVSVASRDKEALTKCAHHQT
jgi:hypothetical protein